MSPLVYLHRLTFFTNFFTEPYFARYTFQNFGKYRISRTINIILTSLRHHGAISCLATLTHALTRYVFIPEILEWQQTVRNFPGKVSRKLSDFPKILEIPGMEFKFLE